MRNKHTNKALKQGHQHYNDYQGNNGYIETIKPMTFKSIMLGLVCFITLAIVTFYLLTK